MPLHFPDLDTLRLALTTAAVPTEVALAPVQVGFNDNGSIWINTAASLSRAALTALKKLNVELGHPTGPTELTDFTCWPQIFPVERTGDRTVPTVQTPVLFELPTDQLASFVAEMLRLGNDRQSFRHLEDRGTGSSRTLLRVFGPPYYTLLRAIDRNGASVGPIAYLEAAPRVWVELGYTHPFARHLKAPEGKVFLLRPPREWTLLDEGSFREIYEILEFPLPAARSPWTAAELGERFQVPLRLKPAGAPDAAELWVLRDRPVEQLDALVSAADDVRLRQLAFAVAVKDGKQIIVLRVRPSKQAPPVVVVDGIAYRSYLKIPNLFVPSGSVLNPPLRRDTVRKLLADDPGVITWLHPADAGSFVPETLPDTAFRPLSDWIDYVLDHHREELQTWVQAAQFDFEPFVCNDDQQPKPKKPPGEKSDRKSGKSSERDKDELPLTAMVKQKELAVELEDLHVPKAEPNVLEKELAELEARFKAIDGPLDSEEHLALWPEMAIRNGALGRSDDAGLCWMSWFWSASSVGANQAWQWFRSEVGSDAVKQEPSNLRGHCWAAGIGVSGSVKEVTAHDLNRLLALDDPATTDVRSLAAYIFWAARRESPPEILLKRLGKVRHFLEAFEHRLPVRAVWLAWTSLVQLSKGDVLGLARTRDRLLERLFKGGLRAEQDMASFLRFAGGPGNERHRAFRTWMVGLAEQARNWIHTKYSKDPHVGPKAATEAYADLIFAFALGRLGESETCKALLQRATAQLTNKDDVHTFLLRAYTFRVEQALAGQPHQGPLSHELLEDLETMPTSPRYMVDRLRQQSRILEPAQKIEPYRHIYARMGGIEKDLAELPDLTERKEVAGRVDDLLKSNPAHDVRARVLRTGLDLAPRVGEDFALALLAQVGPTSEGLGDPTDAQSLLVQAALLEKSLFAAAHFDRAEYVQALVSRFQRLLATQRSPEQVESLESLAGQCFRGLRKVGMKEEADLLLRQIASRVLESQGVKSLTELFGLPTAKAAKNPHWLAALRTLLHVAAGWLYFGQDAQADQILNAARTLLLANTLSPREQTPLARVYVATLSQARPEAAQRRIEELFKSLDNIRDTFTTNNYYGLHQLNFLESVVLAVVTEDFTMGANVRRWLEDDEFLVRQRIHRDLRALMAQHD